MRRAPAVAVSAAVATAGRRRAVGRLWRRVGAGCASAALLFLGAAASTARAASLAPALDRPAAVFNHPERSVLQAAALAGKRWVAVGERGIVVYSDDAGTTWRQARVPVSVGLNAVRFVDAQRGWAVGHGGAVLATHDGGQTWTRQFDGREGARARLAQARQEGDAGALKVAEREVSDGPDKPLLDLHFDADALHGLVVGAYNMAFATEDGGATWQPVQRRLDNPKGLHLYALRVRGPLVLIAGEQGLVLRSTDGGKTFERLTLPYGGSFFTAELPGGAEMVVAGLRGNLWRSTDGGATWSAVPVPAPLSITASAPDAAGRLWLTTQGGTVLTESAGRVAAIAGGLPPLNGVLPLGPERALGVSMRGVVNIVAGPAEGAPTADIQKASK